MNIHRLRPNQANAEALQAVCAAMEARTDVHLVIDTGMSRIGVQPLGAPELAAFLSERCPRLRVQGVFTHLPVSEVAKLDAGLSCMSLRWAKQAED